MKSASLATGLHQSKNCGQEAAPLARAKSSVLIVAIKQQ
jgi:hypothetical protein